MKVNLKQNKKLEVKSWKSKFQPYTSNLKDHRGITLIALIITIIILLILAIVSIKIAIGDGLFKKAQEAKEQYIIAQEKEQIRLAYSDYKIAQANGDNNYTMQEAMDNQQEGTDVTDITDGWKITFTSTTGYEYELTLDGTITGPISNDSKDEQGDTETITWTKTDEGITSSTGVTVQIGDYVAYSYANPDGARMTRGETGLSFSLEKFCWGADISTVGGGWRVIGVNENGQLELISGSASTPSSGSAATGNYDEDGGVNLKREQIYNNGVEILNRVCNTLYSKEGLGKARSVNINDIYELLESEPAELTTGTLESSFVYSTSTLYNYYPIRLEQQKDVTIDGNTNTTGLSESEAASSCIVIDEDKMNSSEATLGTDLNVTYKKVNSSVKVKFTNNWVTDLNTKISELTDDTIKEVILGVGDRNWWIATRAISSDTYWGHYVGDFGMFRMLNGATVDGASNSNYRSSSTDGSNACDNNYGSGNGQLEAWYRPVIELDSSRSINTSSETQDGSFENPWEIL